MSIPANLLDRGVLLKMFATWSEFPCHLEFDACPDRSHIWSKQAVTLRLLINHQIKETLNLDLNYLISYSFCDQDFLVKYRWWYISGNYHLVIFANFEYFICWLFYGLLLYDQLSVTPFDWSPEYHEVGSSNAAKYWYLEGWSYSGANMAARSWVGWTRLIGSRWGTSPGR